MTPSKSIRIPLSARLALVLALGCGRRDDGGAANLADSESAKQIAAGAAAGQVASAGIPGRTASIPTDPCAWLSASEVEEVMGKLTGAPAPAGNACRYPVAPDPALLARKTQLRELARQVPGASDSVVRDSSWNKAAVIVRVDVDVNGVGGRAEVISDQMVSAMLARRSASGDSTDASRQTPEGWDEARGVFSTFEGRLGHVRVTIRESNMMGRLVRFEKKVALAAKVRDRVPDLPFANPNAGVGAATPPGPDPCSLITRAEAEAALGPLVVEPYHIGEVEPLAEASSRSCGYFTKRHHVLVVTPYWSDGKRELALLRGIGNLVSIAAPDADAAAADTLEGPWDEAIRGLDGSLGFLAGDRLLRISYGTSSIDAAQAVRLARTAMARLASSR